MPLTANEIAGLRLGYDHEAENVPRLMNMANVSALQVQNMMSAVADVDAFLTWEEVCALTVCEDQGPQGSCGGNSLSTDLEFIYNRASGEYVQLSRQCAYIWGQGTPRGDNGMSIEGGVKVATGTGVPRESLWPYPKPVRYMTKPPEGVTQAMLLESAAPFKITGVSWMKNYDEGDAWLRSGMGVLYLGIAWRSSMSAGEPVIENFSGGFGGWHALGVLGRSPRKDHLSRRYWWLANSHGPRWGRRGLAEVSPACVEGWFKDGGRIVGLSDLATPVVREWDYKKRIVTH